MESYRLELIASIAVLVAFIVLRFISSQAVEKVGLRFNYHKTRIKLTKKVSNFSLLILSLNVMLFIWGVDQSELVFFITSMLTVLGIAFFAQWSIISNITSSLIIFFNHPSNIGDEISIIDKDYEIKGKISDIGIFFIILKTADGDKVTIPNNVFMQKMIRQKNKS